MVKQYVDALPTTSETLAIGGLATAATMVAAVDNVAF